MRLKILLIYHKNRFILAIQRRITSADRQGGDVMERTILHSDCNCFYASVEMLHHPETRNVPMAVGGDPEARHGIVLTANYIAKRAGVKTGMALWQARQACPQVVFVPPHYDQYIRFSKYAREIYSDFTDLQQPFGLDECWLDVTPSAGIKGDGLRIAEEISRRIKKELGITVSIGVSWNKIFAKLGSDYKKPDAITAFTRDNYRGLVWPLPASDLFYVGRATTAKLCRMGIMTIGDIAESDPELLHSHFGKVGYVLYTYANGWNDDPVYKEGYEAPVKSVGNSCTTPRDLTTDLDVRIIQQALSESVCARLRENGFLCRTVEISVRTNGLIWFSRQKKLKQPTNVTDEVVKAAWELFKANYSWEAPIRSLGVRGTDLVTGQIPVQLDLFMNEQQREKKRKMDRAVDEIRRRFGYYAVQKAFVYEDKDLMRLDAKKDHTIHPEGYFHGAM